MIRILSAEPFNVLYKQPQFYSVSKASTGTLNTGGAWLVVYKRGNEKRGMGNVETRKCKNTETEKYGGHYLACVGWITRSLILSELLFSVAVSCRTGCAIAMQLKEPTCRQFCTDRPASMATAPSKCMKCELIDLMMSSPESSEVSEADESVIITEVIRYVDKVIITFAVVTFFGCLQC